MKELVKTYATLIMRKGVYYDVVFQILWLCPRRGSYGLEVVGEISAGSAHSDVHDDHCFRALSQAERRGL
jgi:hypothetical protein